MSDDHWSPTGPAATESGTGGGPASGGFSAESFEATIRRHPYGGIFTGLGVGWLLGFALVRLLAPGSSGRAERHYGDSYRDEPSREQASGAAGQGRASAGDAPVSAPLRHGESGGTAEDARERMDRVGSAAGQAAERAGELASRAGSVVSGAASSVGQAVSSVYSGAAESMSSAGRRVSVTGAGLARRHPLATCAVGLAIGAAIGTSLPVTETENRLLGETSDAFKERMRGMAAEQVERAKTAAAQAYDEALDEAAAQGIDRETLSRVGEQVGAAAEAARESAQAVADRLNPKPG